MNVDTVDWDTLNGNEFGSLLVPSGRTKVDYGPDYIGSGPESRLLVNFYSNQTTPRLKVIQDDELVLLSGS